MVRHVPIGHFYVFSVCVLHSHRDAAAVCVRGPSARGFFKNSPCYVNMWIFLTLPPLKYLGAGPRWGRRPRFSGTLTNSAKRIRFDAPVVATGADFVSKCVFGAYAIKHVRTMYVHGFGNSLSARGPPSSRFARNQCGLWRFYERTRIVVLRFIIYLCVLSHFGAKRLHENGKYTPRTG